MKQGCVPSKSATTPVDAHTVARALLRLLSLPVVHSPAIVQTASAASGGMRILRGSSAVTTNRATLLSALHRARRLLMQRVAQRSALLAARDIALVMLLLGAIGALYPIPRIAALLSILAVAALPVVLVVR